MRFEGFSGAQSYAREGRMDGAVRVVLGFQAEAVALLVNVAVLALHPIEMVASVELHGRLVGGDFHDTAGLGIAKHGGGLHASAVQDIVMIVDKALFQGLVI